MREERSHDCPVWNGEKLSPFGMYEELAPHIRKLVYTSLRNAYILSREELVDDIVHECFLRAHRHFGKFDANRGKGTPEETLKAWMSRIAWQYVNGYFTSNEYKLRDKPHFTLEENTSVFDVKDTQDDQDESKLQKQAKSISSISGCDWDDLVKRATPLLEPKTPEDLQKYKTEIRPDLMRIKKSLEKASFPHPGDFQLLDSVNPLWRELKNEMDVRQMHQSRPIVRNVYFGHGVFIFRRNKFKSTFERFEEVLETIRRLNRGETVNEQFAKKKKHKGFLPIIKAEIVKIEPNLYLYTRSDLVYYRVLFNKKNNTIKEKFETLEEAREFKIKCLKKFKDI